MAKKLEVDTLETSPCPFCGGTDVVSTQDMRSEGEWFVFCRLCCSRGPAQVSETMALWAWNNMRAK